MRFSLSSWKKALLCKSVLAMTLGAGALALPGCVTTMPGWMGQDEKSAKGPPAGEAAAMVTYWDKCLQMASDPTRGGQRGPCLVGFMTLLKQDYKPVCCRWQCDDQPVG